MEVIAIIAHGNIHLYTDSKFYVMVLGCSTSGKLFQWRFYPGYKSLHEKIGRKAFRHSSWAKKSSMSGGNSFSK